MREEVTEGTSRVKNEAITNSTRLSKWSKKMRQRLTASFEKREKWLILGELGLILLWSIWVGREYFDFNVMNLPRGGEYGLATQSHYVWTLLGKCGACSLWNGFINGGSPAFVELHGAPVHPLVIITSLIFGVINGSKITLVGSLVMAGIAQWWLAKVLGLGRISRVWSAFVCVAAGHLAARMAVGLFTLVLSTAAASLVIAPGLDFALHGKRRSSILLGVMMALALLSGQGYLQIGLLFGILPAFLILLFRDDRSAISIFKGYILSGIIALLLAAVILVPLLHFAPSFYKDIDPEFSTVQPLEYVPLNLVIRDMDFYLSEMFSKKAFPYLYINYVGWIPVLLAIYCLSKVTKEGIKVLAFFIVAIVLVYLAASGITLMGILKIFPGVLFMIRHPSLIAGLAVPLVLGLAAWGLDQLLRIKWPQLGINFDSGLSLQASTKVLIAIPLVMSLISTYELSRLWYKMFPEIPEIQETAVQLLKTETTQWVQPPYGELFWIPRVLEVGLKVTRASRPWGWKGRELPPPYLEGTRHELDFSDPDYVGKVAGVSVQRYPEFEYAYIDTGNKQIPCHAEAMGGNIDVICNAEEDGKLLVRENSWSGWKASMDDAPIALGTGQWLNVLAPSGHHTYEFRYRPWDVPLGILLSFIGVLLCVYFWRNSRS